MKKLVSIIFGMMISTLLFAQDTIPNADFERWTSGGTYEDPDGWQSPNAFTSSFGIVFVTKTTDSYHGNYAAVLETKATPFGGVPGILTNGTIDFTAQSISGGSPYTKRPRGLRGYFKAAPQAGDYGMVLALLTKDSGGPVPDTIAWGTYLFNTTVNTYTRFDAQLNYVSQDTPTHALIIFFSSASSNIQPGSKLWVDSIGFYGTASSMIADFTWFNTCLGDTTVFRDQSTGNPTAWFWDFDDPASGSMNESFDEHPWHVFTSPGTYSVLHAVTDGVDTVYTVKNVTILPLPVADAGEDTTICEGESVQLQASGGTSYSWSPATGLNNPNISNPVASPDTTTVYEVAVTDNNGCTAYDQVTVTVQVCGGIQTPSLAELLDIYPNPVENVLKLQIQDFKEARSLTVNIYNITGQCITSETYQPVPGVDFININVENLPEGIYHVEVTDGIRKSSRKIVISR